MNIYIYGNINFVDKIEQLIDSSNIKLKIEDGIITRIESLNRLKNSIKEEPTDIFIIDETKIIQDDFMSKYLKFMVPKDGIKQSFLDNYGVGDISIREFDNLIIYISKRLDSMAPKKIDPKDITSIEEMYEAFEPKEKG
ncbi:MAG: hypothetical protein U9Q30_01460 [Campylobacterota bacterium]|nr:hypothetical protein [Campylobacterota bacterium]